MAYFETTSGAQFSNAQAVTATADATNLFDVTGAGSGNAPAMIGAGGVNTAMGFDIGAGDSASAPEVMIIVTAKTTVTGSLSFTLSAAPDNGSYSPGTYTVLYTSASVTGTQLAVGSVYKFAVPPVIPGQALPRFYKLTYTVVSGSISIVTSAFVLLNGSVPRIATLYGNNYIAL